VLTLLETEVEDALRKSILYTCILLALLPLGFGVVHQASSQSENLKVLNYSWYINSIGGFNVVGEVQNVGSNTLNPVVLYCTVYTPDGMAQLQSIPCVVYVNYMLPQQKAPFLMEFPLKDLSWLSQGVDNVEFGVVQANATDKYQYPDLAITSSAGSTDAEGIYWVSGTVQNTGTKTATNVRVIATFYNASNVVVAAGYTDPLTPILLNPSSSASFKVGGFDQNQTEATPDRRISGYTLMVQTQEPLLSGTPPPASSSNSSSTPPPSSTDSSSDGDSSNPLSPDAPYIAIIAVVAIVIIAVLLIFNRRKSGKASTEKDTKSQTVGKRRPSSRNRS
jgi:hypothetical protein